MLHHSFSIQDIGATVNDFQLKLDDVGQLLLCTVRSLEYTDMDSPSRPLYVKKKYTNYFNYLVQ